MFSLWRRYCVLIVTCLLLCSYAFGQGEGDSVKIFFRQGYSTLNTSLHNNKESLAQIEDRLKAHYADSLFVLKSISVIGGASPEGNISINKKLSVKRANTLFNHLSKSFDLPNYLKTITYLGRDWLGLLQLVEADPNVPHREDVIVLLKTIVARSADGEKAEDKNLEQLQRIHNGEPYRYMYRKLFPELRASSVILYYTYGRELSLVGLPPKSLGNFTLSPQPIDAVETTPVESRSLDMALKTNMIYDALLVPNVGAEVYLGHDLSVGLNGMFAWWKNDNKAWYRRIYGADIYLRRWFGQQSRRELFTGHHIGIYASTFTYDLAQSGRGEIGGAPGGNIFDKANFSAGVEYGYSMPLTNRLNLDVSMGVGYMWGEYQKYTAIDDCYVWQSTNNRKYIGPTKFEISLTWKLQQIKLRKGGKR